MTPSKQFLEFIDNAANKEDVATLFAKLKEFLEETKRALEESRTQDRDEGRQTMERLSKELLGAKQELLGRADTDKETMYSESRTLQRLIEQKIDEVRGEMPEMPDMEPMHQEFQMRLAEIESKIPTLPEIPEQFDPTEIVSTLEEHEREIEELKKRPVGRSGGTSAIGVAATFKYIAHTEEPVGAIDGVNTTYTVKNTIWWIAGFTLNGEQIAELPNFTYANRTITFTTALPAAYSGKDFEIKYIGT